MGVAYEEKPTGSSFKFVAWVELIPASGRAAEVARNFRLLGLVIMGAFMINYFVGLVMLNLSICLPSWFSTRIASFVGSKSMLTNE